MSKEAIFRSPEDGDEVELFRRIAAGDGVARDRLVERYLPLAHRLASRYRNTTQDLEDLKQVAGLALVKAVDRFDPDRGSPFTVFAVPTILGELKRHFRDHAWAVRVPRHLQERRAQVSEAIADLTTGNGRAPTVRQIAEYLELTVEEVLEAERAGEAFEAVSLDQPQSQTEDAQTLGDSIGETEIGFEFAEYSVASEKVWNQLSERDRTILRMRFLDDMTQTEIAQEVGVSQMQVSRILRSVLRFLRESALEDFETEGA